MAFRWGRLMVPGGWAVSCAMSASVPPASVHAVPAPQSTPVEELAASHADEDGFWTNPDYFNDRIVWDHMIDSSVPGQAREATNGTLKGFRLAPPTRPFWEFDSGWLMHARVYLCSLTLLLAGVLCSAGGIGGGGIYVTVLIVVGQLEVQDAVPLSKAVVFMGSLSTLALNLIKAPGGASARASLIDFSMVRLVVPFALLGTFLGVSLNSTVGDAVILLLLTGTLIAITGMVGRQAYTQYVEEEQALERDAQAEGQPGGAGGDPERDPLLREEHPAAAAASSSHARPQSGFTTMDLALPVLLLVVVLCGITNFYVSACDNVLRGDGSLFGDSHRACHPPALFWLGPFGGFHPLVADGVDSIRFLFRLIPGIACTGVGIFYTYECVSAGKWQIQDALLVEGTALATGCMAGLVGIGGGLIFCPFFLFMGVEPAVAVATSSTCVLFTSSSSTLQYIFTDRVISSLALLYGLTNLAASYVGTKCVHILQDNFASRRSYITMIVFAGVLISACLAVGKITGEVE